MTRRFTINFDYRCPFARNANEHVLAALEAGADYDVDFLGFSLTEVHRGPDDPPVFEALEKAPDLLALAAGIAVRDSDPDRFFAVHRSLFAARHDDARDLREEIVVREALERAGVDPDAVLDQVASGKPTAQLRAEHEDSVAKHGVFGVPTFVQEERAVFVRLLTRPDGDGELARTTIDGVLELIAEFPALNEFKYTKIPR